MSIMRTFKRTILRNSGLPKKVVKKMANKTRLRVLETPKEKKKG